jgi:hypothetical protein
MIGYDRYSDWLRAGRPWSRGLIPGRGNRFLSTLQLPDREADHSPPSVPRLRTVKNSGDIHILLIHIHGEWCLSN